MQRRCNLTARNVDATGPDLPSLSRQSPRLGGDIMAITVPTPATPQHLVPGARRQLLIDGEWRDASSGATFETHDPATGVLLASVAEGDAHDIDVAVSAARRALEDGPWSRLSPSERGRIIHRVGDLVMEHADEL